MLYYVVNVPNPMWRPFSALHILKRAKLFTALKTIYIFICKNLRSRDLVVKISIINHIKQTSPFDLYQEE